MPELSAGRRFRLESWRRRDRAFEEPANRLLPAARSHTGSGPLSNSASRQRFAPHRARASEQKRRKRKPTSVPKRDDQDRRNGRWKGTRTPCGGRRARQRHRKRPEMGGSAASAGPVRTKTPEKQRTSTG